jgi:hypothetical protein
VNLSRLLVRQQSFLQAEVERFVQSAVLLVIHQVSVAWSLALALLRC